ncbi:MAG: potassium channel family protein [Pyrinomonadaceae bacterium]
MTSSLSTTLGLLLLLLVAYDVYATILHARKRPGPISDTLNRIIWRAARAVAFRFNRQRRHQLLNAVGPLLLPSLIGMFIVLLVTGFALIYWPRMPSHFSVDPEATSPAWIEALYFSGTTLTTVGFGDISPIATSMRLVAFIECTSGFALISLAVTYLLTVYGALERKRAIARSFYHQAEEGADVAGFLAHHFIKGKFYGMETALGTAARDIQGLMESHIEHPVIHYFHTQEVYKSLPRMLFLSLEICSVIQSCLDPEEYVETHSHPEMRTLQASASHMLAQVVEALSLEKEAEKRIEDQFEESRRWHRRYKQTMSRLKESGIATNPEVQAGFVQYRANRQEWEKRLHRFAHFMGYDWDEITGDRDLNYAHDEEMAEPDSGQSGTL